MRHQMKTSKKILKLMGRTDLAVYTGAASATELGNRTPASGALIKALEQGPLTIVAIGRLTNIATVLLLRPDLIDNIQEIIVNAGRRLEYAPLFGRRKINFPDTNVDGDPIAFKVLEELRAPLTMIPTESMKTSLWLKGQIRQMRRSKDPMLRWLGRKSRLWRWVWKIFLGGPGFIPWDLFAISYLTHREDFKCHLDIPWKIQELPNNTHSLFRWKKRPKSKLFLVSSFNITSKNTGTYCYNIRSGHLDRLLNQWIR
jgi:inosine-uridine nucleoside N-ribohydrolase